MQWLERDFRWALLGTTGLSILGWFIYSFTPDTWVLIALFFAIIAITVFSWTFFIFPTRRIAILTTTYVMLLLLLRLSHLRHPLYAILLLAFFISLEVMRRKR